MAIKELINTDIRYKVINSINMKKNHGSQFQEAQHILTNCPCISNTQSLSL